MDIKRSGILIWAVMAAVGGCTDVGFKRSAGFSVQPGDLLFRDSNCGPICDAIKKVTTGYKGAKLTHVGIAARDENGRTIVIEAVSAGVKETDLQEFLNRSTSDSNQPKVVVGRLKQSYRRLIPAAIKEAEALKGKPYDKGFEIDNDAYYCSELIYEIFRRANAGRPVFMLEPMTFKDPKTGLTLPAWREYFSNLGVEIPEGKPGINPGAISRSPAIDIVYMSPAPSKTR
jgi:hypothetical protein